MSQMQLSTPFVARNCEYHGDVAVPLCSPEHTREAQIALSRSHIPTLPGSRRAALLATLLLATADLGDDGVTDGDRSLPIITFSEEGQPKEACMSTNRFQGQGQGNSIRSGYELERWDERCKTNKTGTEAVRYTRNNQRVFT